VDKGYNLVTLSGLVSVALDLAAMLNMVIASRSQCDACGYNSQQNSNHNI
jgi:hypothetical protein